MPQTFAVILFLNSLKILLLFPNPLLIILTLFSTSKVKNIVNTCYTATSVYIQHSLACWSPALIWKKSLVLWKHIWLLQNDNDKSSTLYLLWSVLKLALQLSAIFTTWSKLEVYLHHTPYFHTETLAIILELFSILYCCYYSQNYSGIIISGLLGLLVCSPVHCGM